MWLKNWALRILSQVSPGFQVSDRFRTGFLEKSLLAENRADAIINVRSSIQVDPFCPALQHVEMPKKQFNMSDGYVPFRNPFSFRSRD